MTKALANGDETNSSKAMAQLMTRAYRAGVGVGCSLNLNVLALLLGVSSNVKGELSPG